MARNGYPDDPDNYSESDPTQYANYGGTGGEAYSEYGPPTGYTAPGAPVASTGRYPATPPPPAPWHQRPAVLVGLGVLTAAVLALLVYAVVKFTTAGTSESPAVTSSSVAPTSSTAPAPAPAPATESSSAAPEPSTATQTVAPAPPPTTVTTTVTPTTSAAPTTTEAPSPSTTTSVTTSVTTVTETTTRPLFPNWPRPTRPTLLEPPAGG